MILTMMKGKIHRATVTQCDLHYEGSITIDSTLMEAADLLPNEQVDVLNVNNGERFTTYALKGEPGSGVIGLNGAAARRAQKGDLVIICAYARMEKEEALSFNPSVVFVDEHNQIKTLCNKSGHSESEILELKKAS